MKKWIFIGGVTIQCILSLILYHNAPIDAHYDLDSYGYERIAQNFTQNNILKDPMLVDIPIQTMGYPLIIGLLFKLTGFSIAWMVFLQVICWLIISFLMYNISRQLFNEQVALIAFLLSSINLGYLIFSQFLLAEIMLATCLLGSFERLYAYYRHIKYYNLIISALLYSFSMLIKPVIIGWLCILSIYFLIKGKHHCIKKIHIVSMFIFIFMIPVTFYMYHNKKVFGKFYLAPVAHESLYIYFLSKLLMHEYKLNKKEAFDESYALAAPKNDKAVWQESKDTLQWFLTYRSLLTAKIWLQNIVKTLCGFYTSQLKLYCNPHTQTKLHSFFDSDQLIIKYLYYYLIDDIPYQFMKLLAYFYGIYVIGQFFFILYACMHLIYAHAYDLLLLFFSIISYLSMITGHDGCARFRIMFEWVYIILTAYGIFVFFSFLIWYTKSLLSYEKKEMYAQ